MKTNLLLYIIIGLFLINLISAFDEQALAICGGDSELKILCNGQVEQLYEIPEFVDASILFPDDTDINTPTFTLIVNTSNILVCTYSLDNIANISLGAVNHYFTTPVSVADGNHAVDVWCRDTFNLNNSYHDSVSFYVYTISGIGSGGIPIKLYRIMIFGNSWVINESNIVNVNTFDINNNFIDPDSVNITIVSNVDLNSKKILRINKGEYEGIFNISSSKSDEIILNITVIEQNKIISNLFTINLEKLSTFEEIKDYTLDGVSNLASFYQRYFILIWIMAIAIIIGIAYYILIVKIENIKGR